MKCKVDLERIVQERYVCKHSHIFFLIASNTKNLNSRKKMKSSNATEKQ